MAEAFRDAGYSTFGVVRITHLHPDFGFDQGFAEYRYFGSDEVARDETLRFAAEADRMLDAGAELVDLHGTETQRFNATTNRAWIAFDRGQVRLAEQLFSRLAEDAGFRVLHVPAHMLLLASTAGGFES